MAAKTDWATGNDVNATDLNNLGTEVNGKAAAADVTTGLAGKQDVDADLTALAALDSPATKLAGIATGATANDTDANLKDRANHTGGQAVSTISDSGTVGRTVVQSETQAAGRDALSVPGRWASTKICTLGDSWTAGNQDGSGTTYPGLLATALGWATVTNAGHSGWTSTEIAALWGAPFTLSAFTTATDATTWTTVAITAPTTTYRVSSSLTMTWVGELRLASGVIIAGTLRHVAISATWSDGWAFQRTSAGTAVSAPAGALFVCTQHDTLKESTLVIEVGRNNFTSTDAPEVVVRDVNAIRTAHLAPGAPFLVLSVPTAASETAGTVPHSRVRRVNTALKAAFPNEFTDIRRYMIDRGLAVTGTTVTSTDVDQMVPDTIPQSLLVSPAYDHPKAAGYKAITAAVLDGLSRGGALTGPSAGVSGVTTTALGPLLWAAGNTTDPLGSPLNNVQDRSGTAIMQAADTASAPTVVSVNGRRVWRFDGVDDRLWAFIGTLPQPFTVISKLTVRDFQGQGVGVFWTFDTPGASLSIATTGRVILDAGTTLQTATGQVALGAPVTVAAVANGASSSVGVVGALTTGDAGTRGIVTLGQIGRYASGGTNYPSAIDLDTVFVAPWAMTEAQINTLAAQIDLAAPISVATGGTGATTLTGLVKGNGQAAMTAAVAGTDYLSPAGVETASNKTLAAPALTGTSLVAQGGEVLLHNTADQVTNYERVALRWTTSAFRILSEKGGTGAVRDIVMGAFGTIRSYGSAQGPAIGCIQIAVNTGAVTATVAGVNGTLSAASGTQYGLSVSPTLNQSATAAYTALLINPTETATGSGAKKLIDAQVGGTSKFTVDNAGVVTATPSATAGTAIVRGSVPATATSTGVAGQVAFDASFVYCCTAPNTWVRAALATW